MGHELIMRPVYASRVFSAPMNSNNHEEYRPWDVTAVCGGVRVVVDSEWWESVLPDTKQRMLAYLRATHANVQFETAALELPLNRAERTDAVLAAETVLYLGYVHMFNQHVWVRADGVEIRVEDVCLADPHEGGDASHRAGEAQDGTNAQAEEEEEEGAWMEWLDMPENDVSAATEEPVLDSPPAAVCTADAVFISGSARHDGIVILSVDEIEALATRAREGESAPMSQLTMLERRVAACAKHVAQRGGGNALFAKLCMTSGKNAPQYEHEPVRATRVRQIMTHFWGNSEFLKAYEKCLRYKGLYDVALVLQPWVASIDAGNEFRVFVYRRRVTAIAQQKCYQKFAFTLDLRKAADAMVAHYDSALRDALPYRDAVLDMWVDPGCYSAHLIECNSFGAGFAAGSSLFHWIDDDDKLRNVDGKVYVKYATCCRIEE